MKKFWVLLKKEIKELMTAQLILPFVIVVIIFYFIGGYLQNETKKVNTNYQPIAIMDLDQSQLSKEIITFLESQNFKIDKFVKSNLTNDFENYLKENKINSGIIIPQNFQIDAESLRAPHLMTYSQITGFSLIASMKSASLPTVTALINNLVSDKIINGKIKSDNAALLKNPYITVENVMINNKTAVTSARQIITFASQQTMFIPIILFMVIILSAQMVAVAIATEKENKTLETLLSTPVDRKIIVSAKMLAAGIIALVMAAVYMLGFKNYINGISGGSFSSSGEGIKDAITQLGLSLSNSDYIILGIGLFVGILLALAIAMILGAFAEDAKSAQSVIAPLMVLTLIPYFLTLFADINTLQPIIKYIVYLIPFTHTFLAGQYLTLGQVQPVILGIIYQFVVFIIFVYIAARIFSSDYIMTMKLNFGKKNKI